MVTVNDSKISFVWGSCFADHLWGDNQSAPMLWRKPPYVLEFNQQRAGSGSGALDFAWYRGQKSAFWRHYLGGQALGEVRGSDAWEALVPFRLLTYIPDVETDQGERIVIDTYGYELGVVVVLTVNAFKRASATLDQWVDRLSALRRDPVYLLDAGAGARTADIVQVMDAIAKSLRDQAYGGGGASVSSNDPISIANIVQATGGIPGVPVDAILQRYLHAVTAWPGNWKTAVLPTLGASPPFLPQRATNQLPNDALYAVGRSLAVWRPGLFAPPAPGAGKRRRHTLSCFGHNLSAAAAQAEYLRLIAVAYAAQSKLRDRLDSGRVRAVGARIDALLRGAGTTYRSDSVKQILTDKNSKEQVNALLALAGADPIS